MPPMRLLVPLFLLAAPLLADAPVVESQKVVLRVDPAERTWHATVEAVVRGPGRLEAEGWTPASIEVGEETTVTLERGGTLQPGPVAILDRDWFLEADSPLTVTIETPDPWRAVADGRRAGEDLAGGRWATTYELVRASTSPVVIGPWPRRTSSSARARLRW